MLTSDEAKTPRSTFSSVAQSSPGRSSRLRGHYCLLAAAFIGGLSLTAGCGHGGAKVTFPAKTPQASPPAGSSSASLTTQGAVRAAYLAFWDASERATQAPADQVKSTLEKYSTGSYLDFQAGQIISARKNNQEPWGKVVRHIGPIGVTGGKATVHDCQDASGAGLADTRTGKLIAGTRGPKQRNLIAYLVRGSDEQWRVYSLKQFKEPCASAGASPSSP